MDPMRMLMGAMGGGSDPMAALLTMMRGGNPMALLQQLARRDPRINQAMGMIQGKNSGQLRSLLENMAREAGTTPEALARQYGLTLPKN